MRETEKRMRDNRGFSLINVIIAVAFIGIMGMLVLYLALHNFTMKVSGIKGKDSFYTAEQALEEIRLGLQQDVGDAMSRAYIKVMETYNVDSNNSDMAMDEVRPAAFEKEFLEELRKSLQTFEQNGTKVSAQAGQYSMDRLKAYVDLEGKINQDTETLIVTNPEGREPVLQEEEDKGMLLKNLKVIYVSPKGLASIIETDIRLDIPKVRFPTPSTLPDLMSMIVVAEGGIICEGQAGSATTITGSIYAGTLNTDDVTELKGQNAVSIWTKSGSNLSITSGDKVVTASEIKVDNGSKFSTAFGVNLWSQGLRMNSADVELLGTTYFADDLTVEKGKGSTVKIQGDYYGYGYPSSAKSSLNKTQNGDTSAAGSQRKYDGLSDADLSSAIVINGRDTTVDLSGVTRLLLAGRNYVAASAKSVSGDNKTNSDVITGDSISVKGAQLAYLLPYQLLNVDGDVQKSNPMTMTDYDKSDLKDKSASELVDWDMPVTAWGGKTLREIGVDSNNPVQTVFYNGQGGTVYFYLNFSSDEKASKFMSDYYSQQKERMDQYFSFYFGTGAGITVKDRNSYMRYVTNGNVLTYDGTGEAGSLKSATDTTLSEKLQQEEVNLQNTWYALNRKMITSVDLLKTDVADSDGIVHDETAYTRSVFDNLVNEKQMVQFLVKEAPSSLQYDYEANADNGGLKAIMAHNGKSSTFEIKDEAGGTVQTQTVKGTDQTLKITSDMARKLRLVICTGDVEIESGVNFKGIIMAKGKITLGVGAKLESASLEAAKVFQSVIGEGEGKISPQDFFWEGDKYVLGNSTSKDEANNGSTGSNPGTYKLSDYVNYENWRKE